MGTDKDVPYFDDNYLRVQTCGFQRPYLVRCPAITRKPEGPLGAFDASMREHPQTHVISGHITIPMRQLGRLCADVQEDAPPNHTLLFYHPREELEHDVQVLYQYRTMGDKRKHLLEGLVDMTPLENRVRAIETFEKYVMYCGGTRTDALIDIMIDPRIPPAQHELLKVYHACGDLDTMERTQALYRMECKALEQSLLTITARLCNLVVLLTSHHKVHRLPSVSIVNRRDQIVQRVEPDELNLMREKSPTALVQGLRDAVRATILGKRYKVIKEDRPQRRQSRDYAPPKQWTPQDDAEDDEDDATDDGNENDN